MCVLSIKVPIRKESGNLSNAPCMSLNQKRRKKNIRVGKAWTNTDRLSIKWNCDFKKWGFLPSCGSVASTVLMHHVDANKTHGEKTL